MTKSGDMEIVLLRPDEVLVDRDHWVQRVFNETHARRIAKEYSPALFGLGHVSLRGDGCYYLMDGQHRCFAAIASKHGAVPVPFQVHRGLSIEQEAAMFRKLNANKLNVNAFSMFKTGVTANNPICVEVDRIVKSFGLSVGMGGSEGTVSAVAALLELYEGKVRSVEKKQKQSTELPKSHLLTRTLTVLTQAWGRDRTAFDGVLLKSVAAFIYKHDTKMEGGKLARALAKNESPVRLIGKIKSVRETMRISAVAAGVQCLEGVYNRRLSESKRLK